MRWFNALVITIASCALLMGCANRVVQDLDNSNREHSASDGASARPVGTKQDVAPDNTAINERDGDDRLKTPFDQSNAQADIDITARIRQRIVDLPGLSVNARNVKIVTAGGQVTLRGPVANADEQAAIEKIAKDVAGAAKVDSQLEIAD